MEQGPIITEAALKHGVSDENMLHALAHSMRTYTLDLERGGVMHIGPGTDGRLYEVGVIEWYQDIAIVHAMPAREKYLR